MKKVVFSIHPPKGSMFDKYRNNILEYLEKGYSVSKTHYLLFKENNKYKYAKLRHYCRELNVGANRNSIKEGKVFLNSKNIANFIRG